jgi:hypothetical protein
VENEVAAVRETASLWAAAVERGDLDALGSLMAEAHHGVEMDKARSFPAEAFGPRIVGFRFEESGTTATDEVAAPATAETPVSSQGASQTTMRKPARTGKGKGATATA